MLEKIWNFIESIQLYVEAALFVATAVVSFRAGMLADNRNRRKLRKILRFKKGVPCEVMLPTWSGNLEYTADEIAVFKEKYGRDVALHDYIQMNEAEALLHIQNICDMADLDTAFILKKPTASDLNDRNNKIFCGGPLSNVYLKNIFSKNESSPFSFKRKFLFGCKPHWYQNEYGSRFSDIEREIPEDTVGRVLFVEQLPEEGGGFETIKIPNSYIVLIRYFSKKRGTFFISFGNSAVTSMKGIKCLIEDTEEIYDLTKKHKEHFFIIFKCSANGDLSFEEDNIIDLTQKMFGVD